MIFCDVSVLSVCQFVSPLKKVNCLASFSHLKTTDKNNKKKKKEQQKRNRSFTKFSSTTSERERENEKTTKKTKDEFDEIRPTNAFMGRKRSEVTLVCENSGLGFRGDERGSGEESHLGWNLATDRVRFAETIGGRERLGE